MEYKAEIKEIHKLDRKPFGDKNDIYTYQVTTTKHTGLVYTSELNIAKGDYIEYDYVQQKNGWKIKLAEQQIKKPMYNNFEKKQDYSSQPRLSTARSILFQVAYKGVIELVAAGKININDVEEYTNKHFKILDK
jgi:hypothetical protein|tara:strand:- start:522 stop:923 length:402 start_codon:yes stop_codon:yes gene_type:complete